MQSFLSLLKQKFWPISAILFGPWHAPLMLSAVAGLTAGTALGDLIATNYDSIKSVLVILFSIYFMIAFMMWVVHRPEQAKGERTKASYEEIIGLSTKQIIGWGLVGMVMIPALVGLSVFANREYFLDTIQYIVSQDAAVNSGFIWLISISTLVMVPIMVIWLVWMWLAWSKSDYSQVEAESWNYEYE